MSIWLLVAFVSANALSLRVRFRIRYLSLDNLLGVRVEWWNTGLRVTAFAGRPARTAIAITTV